MIIVWLSTGYGRAFFAEATAQNLVGKTWILSDALTADEKDYSHQGFLQTMANFSMLRDSKPLEF